MQIQHTPSPIKEHASTLQKKAPTSDNGKGQAPSLEKSAGLASPKDSQEQSTYLKVVSRLEHMLQKEALPEKALKGFLKAVNARLESATAHDKKMVLNTPEAKALEIVKVAEFVEKIEEGLEAQENVPKVLALLKQPKFIEMMNGQSQASAPVYGPDGKAAASHKKSPEAKIPHPETSGVGTDPKQALAALKSMQTETKGSAESSVASA